MHSSYNLYVITTVLFKGVHKKMHAFPEEF